MHSGIHMESMYSYLILTASSLPKNEDMSAQRSRVDPMKEDADVFPKRILDGIELIEEYTKGRSEVRRQRWITMGESPNVARTEDYETRSKVRQVTVLAEAR